ncbi:3-hydroxyacyl-CoA dehydrogenase family protein [Amycolatopsis pithecellobii]|uniref:3-hydroxybutyryl-CoA dehydrogenase n=1 Tax=Amycolatopsis pithecellobii TaxID=664692 RepID=A0A6N7Z2I1_9PSEU|nr:3-hydroxyacyl-CoA dehydrogenase family protein [Amycolatopsis pithecellobii]MTD52896.1 3-hydroxybutyryl-CoA dehydrogenase [Amycolatopsis pithecellobii]
MSAEIREVLVVGAGLMGSGIAQVAAQGGFQVTLVDTGEEVLARGLARIEDSLTRLVRSGRLGEVAAADARARIGTTTDLVEAARGADLVIEAIVEDLDAKQALFAKLGDSCRPDVVLATNTSQFQISRIAEPCERPERVIGVHFSNPPPLMTLVEVILGDHTSEAALEVTREFLAACDREIVLCRKDVPGFISNRLSTALCMEAARLVDEGIATPEDVDKVARLMYGHKMGPIATLDLAGLDTALRVSTALSEHYGGDRFTPPPILAQLVEQSRYGNKSGAGFYENGSSQLAV